MKQIKVNLNRIIRLEESRLEDIESVDDYVEELERLQGMIDYHINRCKMWETESPKGKKAYRKLNDFLETLEG